MMENDSLQTQIGQKYLQEHAGDIDWHYPNNPEANDVLFLINCYENVYKYHTPFWTSSYCITSTLEVFGYIALFILTVFVLIISIVIHRKTYGNKCRCKIFFRKIRHRIFILTGLMLITAIVKENFFLNDWNTPALIVLQALRFLITATSIMSFIYSAEALMMKNQIRKYIYFMWIFCVASMLTYLAIGIYE